MATKKFSGAPFGTQTARFDVTGVHPKSKLPGSFTQIPYDKFSMVEQKRSSSSSQRDSRSSFRNSFCPDSTLIENRLDRVDNNLKQIRTSLGNAKSNMADIEKIKNQRLHGSSASSERSSTQQWSKTCRFTLDEANDRLENYEFTEVPSNITEGEEVGGDTSSTSESAAVNVSGNAAEDQLERISSHDSSKISSASTSKRISFEIDVGRKGSDISKKKVKDLLCAKETLNTVKEKLNASSCVGLNVEEVTSDTAVFKNPKVMKNIDGDVLTLQTPVNSKESLTIVGFPKRLSIKNTGPPCHILVKRKLGPGAYNTMMGGFATTAVDQKASGPGWGRQLEVERLAALPHLLYKEQWEENKMLKRKLGPGSYEIKDFIQTNNLKPRSSKGICENLAQRFDKGVTSFTPGPGTYGIGGIPQKAIEEKCQQSISTKGMLDSGDRKRNLPSVGSHLGPGTYRHKTCTEEMINKVTSLKGPYELYSGDRNKPISDGYQAAPKLADLGPGQYEIGSFVDELSGAHKKAHGGFGKMAQYPEVPTERLFLFSQAHCPNKKLVPGPGAYSLQQLSKPQAVNSPGFLSSAKRDDKISQKFFTRNFNPVGAGRYDIQKYQDAQDINGHSSAFKSKTGKPNLQMAKFLQERMRAKDIPVEERMFICEPGKPALSRSVTVI